MTKVDVVITLDDGKKIICDFEFDEKLKVTKSKPKIIQSNPFKADTCNYFIYNLARDGFFNSGSKSAQDISVEIKTSGFTFTPQEVQANMNNLLKSKKILFRKIIPPKGSTDYLKYELKKPIQ